MILEKAIKYTGDEEWVCTVKAWAPTKTPKQELCEDAVNRQAVLEQIDSWRKDEFLRVTNPFNYLRKRINSLLPVGSQPKTGYWIDADGDNAICSCCNRLNHLYGMYCKHCGAKMIKPQEDGEKGK